MDLEISSHDLLIDDLLENHWFFENLFTRKSRILRYCHSDPYPSPSTSLTSPLKTGDSDPIKILEDSTERFLIKKHSLNSKEGGSVSGKIRVQEQTQVGSFLRNKEPIVLLESGSCSAPGKIQETSTKSCLIRTPSLPPRVEKREVDREAKRMISKLTRQFSEKIRVLEPIRPNYEGFLHDKKPLIQDKETITERNRTRCLSISLQRTHTMPSNISREDEEEDEIEDQESDSRMGFLIREAITSSHNSPNVSRINKRQKPLRRDLSRSEESLVVKLLQVSSNTKTLRKTLSNIETTKEIHDKMVATRVVTGLATPPRVPRDSRKEMKDQIKFWARAVATNVRQEC
ncbi:unnamed protein product [Cochlearia groenlandica]